MKLMKRIRWILKGSPRCQVCGKPIHKAEDISRGVGSGCQRKLMSLRKKIDNVRGGNAQNT